MIVFTLVSLLLAGFVIWRGIWPFPWRRAGKIILCVLSVLVAAKFHLIRWIGGDYFSPILNRHLLLTLNWLYAFLLFYALLLAAGEIIALLWTGMKHFRPHLPRFPGNGVRAFLAVGAAGLTTIGLIQGNAMPEVLCETLRLPASCQAKGPLRILLLADLHADSVNTRERIAAIVRRCNELDPDLVLIAGDFADGKNDDAGKHLRPLRELRSRYGVFGVPGNHEYFSRDPRWPAFLASLGIRMLENSSETLPCGIAVAGITDEAAKYAGKEMPDPDKAWAEVPSGMPVIFLAHRPHWAHEAARRGAFLQLSGHTHGGMFFPLSSLVARSNGGFVSGRYELPGMTLIVSNGSGIWSGFPIRFGCPARIVCLDLR